MPENKTFLELQAQADAMIALLTIQRNTAIQQLADAQSQMTVMTGHIAILETRLKVLTPEPELTETDKPIDETKSDGSS